MIETIALYLTADTAVSQNEKVYCNDTKCLLYNALFFTQGSKVFISAGGRSNSI